jgi:hypothetical protein
MRVPAPPGPAETVTVADAAAPSESVTVIVVVPAVSAVNVAEVPVELIVPTAVSEDLQLYVSVPPLAVNVTVFPILTVIDDGLMMSGTPLTIRLAVPTLPEPSVAVIVTTPSVNFDVNTPFCVIVPYIDGGSAHQKYVEDIPPVAVKVIEES